MNAVENKVAAMIPYSVAVLAGGKSSRMGRDKALIEVQGRTLIEHVLTRLPQNPAPSETMVITNRPDDYAHLHIPAYPDMLPGKGPLGGIYTAITHSTHTITLVLACDMPLVSTALLAYMLALHTAEPGYDVIVPRVQNHPQGLCAIYGKNCLEPIRRDLEHDLLRVIGFYNTVRVRYLDEPEYGPYDPNRTTFINVNTPDDLARIAHTDASAVSIRYWTLNREDTQPTEGQIIVEQTVRLFVNGRDLATLMCSPHDLEALALGFLFNEGMITTLEEVRLVQINKTAVDVFLDRAEVPLPRRIVLTAGCGGSTRTTALVELFPPLDTAFTTTPDHLFDRMRDLQHAAYLYRRAGSVHSASLCTPDAMLDSAEDIGRHNAVDRLAGRALQNGRSTADCLLLTSGRISSEMVVKARRMAAPLIASRSGPTSMAVQLAETWGICLVGYVRGIHARIYTHAWRLGITGE